MKLFVIEFSEIFSESIALNIICNNSIVMCMSDSRRGFRLDNVIDHFNTQLVTTLNFSAIANIHTLQFTRAHAKSFPARGVFSSSYLVTASNNGYSSDSVFKSSLNGGSLPTA
jgi:hypothetical protein